MFEQTFIPRSKTRKPWTVLVAFIGELALVGVGVLVPLTFVQALPQEQLMTYLVAPTPPPPPPPPPAHLPKAAKVITRSIVPHKLFEPHFVPKAIGIPKQQEMVAPPQAAGITSGVVGGVPGGQLGGAIGGVIGSTGAVLPPPPPPPAAPKAPAPQRIRVGGNVQEGLLIHKVTPEYPTIARTARIQGVVRLSAVIGKDGRVRSLHVISGHPLLVRAALTAVARWTYKPTLLNGVPVEVETEVDVRFELG
ncbi:MAG TPA: energy transducer TonB [Bryobacteraceae bacterium]|nr:energy transducer TonB [Bryobacteraceae bacterium]